MSLVITKEKRRVVSIQGELEVYDIGLQESESKEILRPLKVYVNHSLEIETKLKAYIEKTLDCQFDESCVYAESFANYSMVYCYSTGVRYYTLFIKVICNKSQVKFPKYYLINESA